MRAVHRQEAVIGLSSSKTKQTNAPSAYAKPYITQGATALQGAYQQVQPLATSISNTLGAQLPSLADKAFTPSEGLTAATDYNTDVLGGKYLDAGNPYLQSQIDTTNADVRAQIAAAFSKAGRTGSGANVNALSRGLAANESNLRYTDYSNERQRMGQAASLAPSLDAAQYQGLGAYISAAQAAVGLPQNAASAYAGGVGGLLGGYNTSTTTQSPSLGLMLSQIASNAAQAYTGFK